MRFAFSQGFPHSLYLFLADLEIVPVLGEDFEGDGFIVFGLIEFFHNLFEINDPGPNWQMTVFLSEVVIGVDVADSVTIETDKLRRSIFPTPKIGMANIQSEPDFWKGFEDGLEFMRLGEKAGLRKHIFNAEGDIEVDGLLQDGFERFHGISLGLIQKESS